MQRQRQAPDARLADRERRGRQPVGRVERERAAGQQDGAAAGRAHARQHRLDGSHGAGHVDGEILHQGRGGLGGGRRDMRAIGIVDQHLGARRHVEGAGHAGIGGSERDARPRERRMARRVLRQADLDAAA
jgi:hypothetical protein